VGPAIEVNGFPREQRSSSIAVIARPRFYDAVGRAVEALKKVHRR
jgi:hypothetical protein